jgi:hypothetical protein
MMSTGDVPDLGAFGFQQHRRTRPRCVEQTLGQPRRCELTELTLGWIVGERPQNWPAEHCRA